MKKCLELAVQGKNKTGTNPLVGCVIVYNNITISDGYHEKYGGYHAEKNAINNLKKKHPTDYKKLLEQSTLYVNLEPCSHFGKTPPCIDLIIKYKIPQIIIGTMDPFTQVNGKGINKLKKYSKVIVGILEKECLEINHQYFTNHIFNRPFIILKWAESKDGFINTKSKGIKKISNKDSIQLSHKWRSQVDAIMVGTNTVICDNPTLTTRKFKGNNPIRVTIDRKNRLTHKNWNILNHESNTIIFNEKLSKKEHNIEYINYMNYKYQDKGNLIIMMKILYEKGIKSILIEGGAQLLNNYINNNLWDEARVFVSNKILNDGVKAPKFNYKNKDTNNIKVDSDSLYIKKNYQ